MEFPKKLLENSRLNENVITHGPYFSIFDGGLNSIRAQACNIQPGDGCNHNRLLIEKLSKCLVIKQVSPRDWSVECRSSELCCLPRSSPHLSYTHTSVSSYHYSIRYISRVYHTLLKYNFDLYETFNLMQITRSFQKHFNKSSAV